MSSSYTQYIQSLDRALASHGENPELQVIRANLHAASDAAKLINTYKAALPLLEQELWRHALSDQTIQTYQTLFRELENLIDTQAADHRYEFVIVIPIADRPRHLQACLNSLLDLCRAFNYGGFNDGRYQKLSVIIADDSKHTINIEAHRKLAQQYTDLGIRTDYFGLEQQLARLDALTADERQSLERVLGNQDRRSFFHKGASIMRNITYLKLSDMAKANDRLLFFFIDSDQEFQVKISTPGGDRNVYTTNYFYYLNEIFSTTPSRILTGKVVGDPPVSPAVMAAGFMDDVIGFLEQIARMQADQACCFHARMTQAHEGAYHDMAALFGFQPETLPHDYACPLSGEHDLTQCLIRFSSVLDHFFYGEHPTRSTYYKHDDILAGLKPARTIYTGNYVIRPDALSYFIPFARLKLRMAGPTLGRLIKSEIGSQFVSANLPMLHKRTVEDSGKSEFRPGIEQQSRLIDLYTEFERQYFGDVMLFSVEKLTDAGYPARSLTTTDILLCLQKTEQDIHRQYLHTHDNTLARLNALSALVNDARQWWHGLDTLATARDHLQSFIANMEHNFGLHSKAHQLLNSDQLRHERLPAMAEAIADYRKDRDCWEKLLSGSSTLKKHP